MRIKAGRPPAQVRREQYPPMGTQLDAIYKGFKALKAQGIPLPDETNRWIETLDRVKEQNPIEKSPMVERNNP